MLMLQEFCAKFRQSAAEVLGGHGDRVCVLGLPKVCSRWFGMEAVGFRVLSPEVEHNARSGLGFRVS